MKVFFWHSAPKAISIAQFCVLLCSEIGLINNGISHKNEIPFLTSVSFDHWHGTKSHNSMLMYRAIFSLISLNFVIKNIFIFSLHLCAIIV